MNHYLAFTYIIMFMVIFIVIHNQNIKNAAVINHRVTRKKQGAQKMKELAEKFIGKNVIIYTISSSIDSIQGTITQVTDNGLLIDDKKGNMQAINLEYVTRICEYPTKSNGKKKKTVS